MGVARSARLLPKDAATTVNAAQDIARVNLMYVWALKVIWRNLMKFADRIPSALVIIAHANKAAVVTKS
jgi:hypothetical protein